MKTPVKQTVKMARKMAGMSQATLAAAAGLSLAGIQRIEAGGAARDASLRAIGQAVVGVYDFGALEAAVAAGKVPRALDPRQLTAQNVVMLDKCLVELREAQAAVNEIADKNTRAALDRLAVSVELLREVARCSLAPAAKGFANIGRKKS